MRVRRHVLFSNLFQSRDFAVQRRLSHASLFESTFGRAVGLFESREFDTRARQLGILGIHVRLERCSIIQGRLLQRFDLRHDDGVQLAKLRDVVLRALLFLFDEFERHLRRLEFRLLGFERRSVHL